jgi:hypothetical protein
MIALYRESNIYSQKKPGHVPPADSPTRPELARLWFVAHQHTRKRKVRTFTYCSHKFGVVYVGDGLCVMDWEWRRLLVRPPTSMEALQALVSSRPCAQRGGHE